MNLTWQVLLRRARPHGLTWRLQDIDHDEAQNAQAGTLNLSKHVKTKTKVNHCQLKGTPSNDEQGTKLFINFPTFLHVQSNHKWDGSTRSTQFGVRDG